MAKIEKLGIGELMYSERFDREFTVSGILERNYTQDDGIFFIPLKVAQKLVGREGKLSAVAIKLKDISSMDATRNTIRGMMPPAHYVIGSKELSEGILQFFGSTRAIMMVMVIVAGIISVFGVVNTMLMAVLERRREIAYLKCVGAGGFDLLRLISLETLAISAPSITELSDSNQPPLLYRHSGLTWATSSVMPMKMSVRSPSSVVTENSLNGITTATSGSFRTFPTISSGTYSGLRPPWAITEAASMGQPSFVM